MKYVEAEAVSLPSLPLPACAQAKRIADIQQCYSLSSSQRGQFYFKGILQGHVGRECTKNDLSPWPVKSGLYC